MAVPYRKLYFESADHEKVSNQWFVLLYNIHTYTDIDFEVTEGHRTMERQQELVDQQGVWSPTNQHGAARPSATAPHIRTGRPDHAIDVGRGADALIYAASRRGVTLRRTVPGEPWHLEADKAQLERYYHIHKKKVWDRIAKSKKPHVPKPKKPTTKSATTIDTKGVQFIAGQEGGQGPDGKFHVYRDAVGVWTIGYGHTHGVGPNTKPITKARAQKLLKAELDSVYVPPVVRTFRAAHVSLRQRELNAIASAVYNLGPGILEPDRTLGHAIRTQSKARIADALLVYNKGGGHVLPGLVKRRKLERKMFLGK